ncbi:MAG: ROK family protein [Propionibacteriaceae bacterium]|jgi:predicted NBD/HSP70 family sugar kinase|nr:ROK family protein [Propionibacteriaceae bacterium]
MLSLGIDIGATKAHGVALDEHNQIVAEHGQFTIRGPEGVRTVLMEVAEKVAERAGIGLRDFDAVGIGIPGVVNRETGVITSAVNLQIEQMPLRKLIAGEFSVPIHMDNDVKVTVVAAGMLLNSLSVTYINLGTGVAAATLAGRLIRGWDNAAGEIGHIVFETDGHPCRCGQRGCIETIIGGAYLAARMNLLELDWTKLDVDPTPAGRAAAAQATSVLARVATMVAMGYASDHIVLGGGVVLAAPWLLPAVKAQLHQFGEVATFPPYDSIAERLMTLEVDIKAPAIGAALIGQGWTEGYKLDPQGNCE